MTCYYYRHTNRSERSYIYRKPYLFRPGGLFQAALWWCRRAAASFTGPRLFRRVIRRVLQNTKRNVMFRTNIKGLTMCGENRGLNKSEERIERSNTAGGGGAAEIF